MTPGGETMAEAITEEAAQYIVNALNIERALDIERTLTRIERTRQDPHWRQKMVSGAEMRRRMAAKGVDVSQLPPLPESTPETVGELVNVG